MFMFRYLKSTGPQKVSSRSLPLLTATLATLLTAVAATLSAAVAATRLVTALTALGRAPR